MFFFLSLLPLTFALDWSKVLKFDLVDFDRVDFERVTKLIFFVFKKLAIEYDKTVE